MKMIDVMEYWSRQRAIGHTHAMLKGALSDEVDAIVLVSNPSIEREFIDMGLNAKSITTSPCLRGLSRPLLVDHHALSVLYFDERHEAHEKYERLRKAAQEYLNASDNSVSPKNNDDVAAMLRFGKAEDNLRRMVKESK